MDETDWQKAEWKLAHATFQREISALREERDRLRAALRKNCIGHCATPDDPKWYCWQCDAEWPGPDVCDEHHAAGCLAALGERSGERE